MVFSRLAQPPVVGVEEVVARFLWLPGSIIIRSSKATAVQHSLNKQQHLCILPSNDGKMGETEEEHIRKKEYNYMTSNILKDRKMHMLASLHFNGRGGIVFLKSAIVTLIQAGLAILAQADLDITNWSVHQSNITVAIAFLAAYSVFWQSLVKNWNYNGRASLHESAAAALGKLYKTSELRRRQEKALKNKGTFGGDAVSETQSPSEEEKTEETAADDDALADGDTKPDSGEGKKEFMDSNLFDQLVKQYEQALEGCTSFVPPGIVAAFELLDNQIGICKRKIDTGLDTGHKIRVEWEKVYPTLYRELYATIITQSGWPILVPDPQKVVKKTLDKFKDEKQVNIELLDILVKRNLGIEKKYKEVGEKYEEVVANVV